MAPPLPLGPHVRFRIGDTGKVHYYERDSAADRASHQADYLALSSQQFLAFKGAGKRYASDKLTDLSTMRNYVRDHTGQFYVFDKNAPWHRGALAPIQPPVGNLLDRSRQSRLNGTLQPFDVGHYKQAPPGSRMDALSGKQQAFGANRDHVVSGESLKRRARAAGANATPAYNQGLTIAIPNDEMHKPHSPTFGGRQASKDTLDGGAPTARAALDAQQPALAFYRDVKTMLRRTRDQNDGTLHASLDLTQSQNRIAQIGGYRTLFRASARMHAADPTRGFDPNAPAREVTHTPKPGEPTKIGSFAATLSPPGTQGGKIAGYLTKSLRKA